MAKTRLDRLGPLPRQQERVETSARKCGLEFQFEAIKVLTAVCDALDELGSRIQPLQRVGADAVLSVAVRSAAA